MTEYWSTLVRGLSRANRAAVEALEVPAETGEDVHVGRGLLSRSKRPQREVVLSTVNIGPSHNLIVLSPLAPQPLHTALWRTSWVVVLHWSLGSDQQSCS